MAASTPNGTPSVASSNIDIPARPTLDELWAFVEPTLNGLMKAGPNDVSLPPERYSAIYTAVCNYSVASKTSGTPYNLSARLEEYFSIIARQLYQDVPQSAADQTLIRSTLNSFNEFKTKARYIDRMFNYYNRHHVRRAEDEGHGWVSLSDMKPPPKGAKAIQNRRKEELKKWGYEQGGSEELLAQSVASAQAGSAPGRIVPVGSVALRQFRLDLIEPLINDAMGSAEGSSGGGVSNGCLARAIEWLLSSGDVEGIDKRGIARDLANMFRDIGILHKDPLCKKLNAFTSQANAQKG